MIAFLAKDYLQNVTKIQVINLLK